MISFEQNYLFHQRKIERKNQLEENKKQNGY